MAVIQAYFGCTFNLERSQTGDRWDESQLYSIGHFGFDFYPFLTPSVRRRLSKEKPKG